MSIFNNILLGASAQSTTTPVHTIDQSIRFNDDDNAYLSRTISSTSSTTTNTISMWVKRANLGNSRSGSGSDALGQTLFQSGRDANNYMELKFGGGTAGGLGTLEDALSLYNVTGGSINMKINTTALFRDVSAFYHVLAIFDTSNQISSERLRLYVNGVRQTNFSSSTFPSKDTETELFRNTSNVLSVGAWVNPSESVRFFDGYMAEITVINGQALDPSSFGEYNSSNIWIPKDVSGLTFGTNGFHIKGESASDLGNDSSSNNNDFTTSGLASHDQVSDSPTNNFCVLSTINMGSALGVTLRDGNLDGRTSGTAGNAPASISLDSGKWYWEVNNHADGSGNNFGVGETPTGSFDQFTSGSNGNAVNTNAKTTTASSGTIIGFKLDFDAGTLTHTTNGTSYSSTGSLTADMAYAPHSRLGGSSGRVVFNFGQDSSFGGLETSGSAGASDGNGVGDFYYSVPSGFLTICTKNLGAE